MGPNVLQFQKNPTVGGKPAGTALIEALTAAKLIQNADPGFFSTTSGRSTETHYHFHLPPEEYSSSEYETKNREYETRSLDEITVESRNIVDDKELLAMTARHLREVNQAVQDLTKYVENILMTIEEREKNEFIR